MRVCKCGVELLTKANSCPACARAYMRTYRAKQLAEGKSKQDVYNYTWRSRNPASYLLQSAKSSAKKHGWDFNLEPSDVTVPDVCPIFGIPLFIKVGGNEKRTNPNNPSLDRIDPNQGYVKGNVRVVSWRANHLKNDGCLEEFKTLVEKWDAR